MAIKVSNLNKQYRNGKVALDDISFEVNDGEIFGLLGPNGAGKSTTMKILTTILKPTAGEILIDGENLKSSPQMIRSKLGYIAQENSLDEQLTGRENLLLQARLYHLNQVEASIDEILNIINLRDDIDVVVSKYSGGMKKRLEIGCALITRPQILFLDEPTLGLDVEVRRDIWKYIKTLNNTFNITVFITTHYLEEADYICDRISIIDKGKILAIGQPQELKRKVGKEKIEISFMCENEAQRLSEYLKEIEYVEVVKNVGKELVIVVDDAELRMRDIYELLRKSNAKVIGLQNRKVSLDDVYLYYTGQKYEKED